MHPVVLPLRGEQEDRRGTVRRRRADRDGVYGLAADCDEVLAITGDVLTGAGGNNGVATSTAANELNTHNGALKLIADTPGIFFPTGLDFDSEDDLWGAPQRQRALRRGHWHDGVPRSTPWNGNTGPIDITVNGAPFTGQMNGLAKTPIGDCEQDTTPTTAPPAPVVAAEPVFTG